MNNNVIEIFYRKAVIEDTDALIELEQKVVEAERPYNSTIKDKGARYYDIPALIANENSLLLVGEYKQKIVATGYVDIRASKPSLKHNKHGYLGFMFVDEKSRGQGVNQRLMEQLISWANDKDVYDFYLDVYDQNLSAIRAYEKLGFKRSLVEMHLSSKD